MEENIHWEKKYSPLYQHTTEYTISFCPKMGQRMYHSKLIFMIGKTSIGKQKAMLIFETGNGK